MTYDRASESREPDVNTNSGSSALLRNEYVQELTQHGNETIQTRPTEEQEVRYQQLLDAKRDWRSTADGGDSSEPQTSNGQQSFEPTRETREELRERLQLERQRTLGVFSNQISDSLINAGYDRQRSQTPDEQSRQIQRRELIERAVQLVPNAIGSDNVEALIRQVNTSLRADGSPYLLTIGSPTDRKMDFKGSDFRGVRVFDINSGNTVEQFDISLRDDIRQSAHYANAVLGGGSFGAGPERQRLSNALRQLHENYGMAGVNNLLDRIHNSDYEINMMRVNTMNGTEFGGISLHHRGTRDTYSDVLWLRDQP